MPTTLKPSTILKEQEPVEVSIAIAALLKRLAKLYQIPNWDSDNEIILTEWIMENYSNETIETITRALTKPVSKEKTWRLTPDSVGEWMAYEIEKESAERERIAHNYKVSETKQNFPEEILKIWKENIDKVPEKRGYSMSDEDVEKEGALKEPKRTYVRPSDEQVIAYQKHIQWIRENYDSLTGRPKENWISEEEFLKRNF